MWALLPALALLYFTGSREHNVRLRGRANEMGYTLNEYQLATLKAEKHVAGRTEEEIYAKLRLDYVPPELRENNGEIEAAEAHKLPQLLNREDVQGDLQMHTTASDGKHSIEEMAAAAQAAGAKVLIVGMQLPPNYGAVYGREFGALFGDVAKARKTAVVPYAFEGFGEDLAQFQPDRVHPTAGAQRRILANVWPALSTLLQRK